ncbi:MAG: polyphosphate kinase 1, partial [Flavobacteriales bacterium]|nr:polyphosphate kinase 1 [Flavobacteriales bacterium]
MTKSPQPIYINREISWLSFNERVLQEANDKSNPLIERIRFLGIFSNNLDEFFRVRVANLYRLTGLGKRATTALDFDPKEVLKEVRTKVLDLQEEYDRIFDDIEKELRTEDIHFVDETELTEVQSEFIRDYFYAKVRPSLVPIMIGSKRDFPELGDDSVYLAVRFKMTVNKEEQLKHAIIELPEHLSRFVVLPSDEKGHYVMFLEDVIRYKLNKVFGIFQPKELEAYTIKITRDAELDIDDDISKSLLEKMTKSLDKRKKGSYVRFVYEKTMP